MNIYLGSDHGGYKLKEQLIAHLKSESNEVIDMGPQALDLTDDYPDISFSVAQAVSADSGSLGVLACRSGQGVCVVANKVPGVRAAVAWNREVGEAGRRDDHINVLCLPGDYITLEEAKAIVDVWLKTEPGQEEKYLRRLKKVAAIEDYESIT